MHNFVNIMEMNGVSAPLGTSSQMEALADDDALNLVNPLNGKSLFVHIVFIYIKKHVNVYK